MRKAEDFKVNHWQKDWGINFVRKQVTWELEA